MGFEVGVHIEDREVFNALNKAGDVKFKQAFAMAIDDVDRRVTPQIPRDKGELAQSKRIRKRVSKASLSITATGPGSLGKVLGVEYGNRRRRGKQPLRNAFDVDRVNRIIFRELNKEFERIRG